MASFIGTGRKIVGVGFNFRSLIAETGEGVVKHPRLFIKAVSSYIQKGQSIKVPAFSTEGLLYQVELGVVIGGPMKHTPPSKVMQNIAGYCVTLDMTCKHALRVARERGLAWDIAKSFDTCTPVGKFIPKDQVPNPGDLDLWLTLNGEERQSGNTSDMTWPISDLISIMSRYFTLNTGDLILTGTPPGMGVCYSGDVIRAGIRELDEITFDLEAE